MIERKLFKIEMKLLSPMHIGGKDEPFSESDNPIATVGGRLCVPGSTLKGAYRNKLERYLYDEYFLKNGGSWKSEDLKPCIPTTAKLMGDEQKKLEESGRFRGPVCQYPPNANNIICPVCYLLGALGLVGFVTVPFLFSDARKEQLYSSTINRATGTVTGGNRPYEIVPNSLNDVVFTGQLEVLWKDPFLGWEFGKKRNLKESGSPDNWIDLVNLTPEDMLKTFVIERLKSIEYIGGYRSKGCGRVEITVAPLDDKPEEQKE